jgi:F-type H+-transporting ATPase subunit b
MNNQQIFNEIIVQILGFLVVLWVLKTFAFGPLLSVIEKRKKTIEEKFADLELKQKQLTQLEADYRAKLEQIDQEARQKIAQAAADGMRVAREIQEKARQDAQAMVERAKTDIQQELDKARVTMRDEIVDISARLTEKVIRQKLTLQDHQRLVDDFIKDLDKVS